MYLDRRIQLIYIHLQIIFFILVWLDNGMNYQKFCSGLFINKDRLFYS